MPDATATAHTTRQTLRAMSRPRGPWPRAWLTGLSIWAAAFASYLLVNWMYWTVGTEKGPASAGEFFDVWNRWDTGHYIYIASYGYNPNSENPAFFPLYPMLMYVLDPVLPGEKLTAGLIISSLACIAALALLYRLISDLYDSKTAERTALYLMAFPFGFFLVAVYNESLFIALCVGALYFMRRGQWWWAGLLAGFSTATRQSGVLLALAFAIEYLRQRDWQIRRIDRDAFAVALVPTGVIGYMIYSWFRFPNHDALKFMHIQSFWGRQLQFPWSGTVGAIRYAEGWSKESPFHAYVVVNIIDIAIVFLLLALLIAAMVGPWKLGPEAWYITAFGAAGFFLVLLTPIGKGLPPLHGVARYALEVLPAFMVLGRMGASRAAERAYLFPAIATQGALLVGFFANVWLS